MWPFSRTVSADTVALTLALDRLSDAVVEAAKIQAGWTQPELPAQPPPAPQPPFRAAFMSWLDGQGYNEFQHEHFVGMFDVVTGKRPAPPGQTREAMRALLAAAGAPLP